MAKYKDHLKGSLAIALEQASAAKGQAAALAVIAAWGERELGDRRRKATEENISEIEAMRAEGLSCYAIAGRVGLSAPTVRRILRAAGKQAVT